MPADTVKVVPAMWVMPKLLNCPKMPDGFMVEERTKRELAPMATEVEPALTYVPWERSTSEELAMLIVPRLLPPSSVPETRMPPLIARVPPASW